MDEELFSNEEEEIIIDDDKGENHDPPPLQKILPLEVDVHVKEKPSSTSAIHLVKFPTSITIEPLAFSSGAAQPTLSTVNSTLRWRVNPDTKKKESNSYFVVIPTLQADGTVSSTEKIVIGNELFNVEKADISKENKELWSFEKKQRQCYFSPLTSKLLVNPNRRRGKKDKEDASLHQKVMLVANPEVESIKQEMRKQNDQYNSYSHLQRSKESILARREHEYGGSLSSGFLEMEDYEEGDLGAIRSGFSKAKKKRFIDTQHEIDQKILDSQTPSKKFKH